MHAHLGRLGIVLSSNLLFFFHITLCGKTENDDKTLTLTWYCQGFTKVLGTTILFPWVLKSLSLDTYLFVKRHSPNRFKTANRYIHRIATTKYFAKMTGKHLPWSFFFNKAVVNDSISGFFSCEFCNSFQNNFWKNNLTIFCNYLWSE